MPVISLTEAAATKVKLIRCLLAPGHLPILGVDEAL